MHRFRKAKRLKPKVKLKKCRITIQGKVFVCSEDHLFLVMRPNGDESYCEWVTTRELLLTDLIVKTALPPEQA